MAGDDEDKESKTEEATSKKLTQAREKGNVPQSQELRTAVNLLAALILVWMIAPTVARHLQTSMGAFLGRVHQVRADTEQELTRLLWGLLIDVAPWAILPLIIVLVLGIGGNLGQVGWIFLPDKIMPDPSKMDPLKGLARMFSKKAVIDLGKNILKLVAVGAVMINVLSPHIKELPLLLDKDLLATLSFTHHLLIKVTFIAVLCMVVIGGGDFVWQRFDFLKEMRMSKQDVKDEHKQTEGDPLIKSRMRGLQIQRSRRRMMQAVPTADVVVTNPTHYAVALKYDGATMRAPTVVAKGTDIIALRIRSIAEENNVPIVENPPLARALHAAVDLDREIHPDHYKAVAEVISYVMRLKGGRR